MYIYITRYLRQYLRTKVASLDGLTTPSVLSFPPPPLDFPRSSRMQKSSPFTSRRVSSRLVSEKSRSSRGNVLGERINTTPSSSSLLSCSSFRTPRFEESRGEPSLLQTLRENRNFLALYYSIEIDFWRSFFRRIHPWILPRRMLEGFVSMDHENYRDLFSFSTEDFPFPRRRDGLVGEDEKCYGYDFE